MEKLKSSGERLGGIHRDAQNLCEVSRAAVSKNELKLNLPKGK